MIKMILPKKMIKQIDNTYYFKNKTKLMLLMQLIKYNEKISG